jgi:hypothetical protein
MKIRSLPALALLGLSTTALAQAEDAPDRIYADETVLEEDAFRDLTVEGELVGPGGTLSVERRTATFPPMIRLRTDFNEELIASTDLIR